jgi:uncharacterized membrane protein HdeD (DUF308 family)
MDYNKVLGVLFIILGLIFIAFPLYSTATVSVIAGICLITFGFASIIDGFSVWSMMAHVSVIKILIGICAMLFGLLFIYEISALSFIFAYQFYLVAFVLIFAGISGIFFAADTTSRLISVLLLILGIVAVYLAFISIAQPLYVAIIFGISLIMEGVLFLTSNIAETE